MCWLTNEHVLGPPPFPMRWRGDFAYYDCTRCDAAFDCTPLPPEWRAKWEEDHR